MLKLLSNSLFFIPFAGLFGCVFILDGQFISGTGVGKEIGFYFCIGWVLLATTICYFIKKQSLRYEPTDLLIPLFILLSLAVTYVVYAAINTQMITLTLLLALYVSFRICLVQRKLYLPVLLFLLMITGLIEAIWGLLQLYDFLPSQHNRFKVTGSFFNPGPYAGYLAMILPVAFYYVLRNSRMIYRPFNRRMVYFYLQWTIALTTLVFSLLILPATMSRASWIAAIIGCAVVFLQYFLRQKHRKNTLQIYWTQHRVRLTRLLIAATILFGTGTALIYHLKKDSADGRAFIWKISVNIIYNEPYGVGLGHFPGKYGASQADYFSTGNGSEQEKLIAGEPEYAFNEFIRICTEVGILPFLIILSAFIYTLYTGIRRGRIATVGSLISLLVFANMSYPFSLIPFLIVLVFLVAACVSTDYQFLYLYDVRNLYLFDFQTRYRWNMAWIILMLTGSWLMTIVAIQNRWPVYQAHKKWSPLKTLYHAGAYEKAVNPYSELYPLLRERADYLFEYGRILSEMGQYTCSNAFLYEATFISGDPMIHIIRGKNFMNIAEYTRAEESFRQAANTVPHRFYPYYMLAKSYHKAGKFTQARDTAQYLLKKQVKVDSPAIREMKDEMRKLIRSIENSLIRTPDKNNAS